MAGPWKGSKAGQGRSAFPRSFTIGGRGIKQIGTPVGDNRSGLPWPSGVSTPTDSSVTQKTDFEVFRNGRLCDGTTLFMGSDFFADPNYNQWMANNNIVSRAGGFVNQIMNANYTVALSVPLLHGYQAGDFTLIKNRLADTASEEYRAHSNHATILQSHVGSQRLYIRLGWEANKGYAWSLADNGVPRAQAQLDSYPLAWARCAQIYKDKLPGVRMIWNHLPDPDPGVFAGLYFPSLAIAGVVDVIGVDVYDRNGRYSTLAEWNAAYGSYNTTTGRINGIGGHLAFARAKGLNLSSEEWGPTNLLYNDDTNPTPPADGSNNAFFCAKMCEFFNANAADIEFENYYNKGPQHQIHPQVAWLPQARVGYHDAWRDIAAIP